MEYTVRNDGRLFVALPSLWGGAVCVAVSQVALKRYALTGGSITARTVLAEHCCYCGVAELGLVQQLPRSPTKVEWM